jgi:parallel beta-helix repeat protein
MRRAFEREARLLAGLRHPTLPVVSDHFREKSDQFLVMQYIEGDDLGVMLERNSTVFAGLETLRQVLTWADQLLDALDYLHSHKPPIIHRDIKPQNLKLTPRGELVLLDFGLAKGSLGSSAMTSTSGRSLRSYTTQYAPLEQIQGTGTEPRSDLYAAGATFYHLLTGVVPPNALTRASAVLASEADPLQPAHISNPELPPELAVVLHQAMAPAIAKRFFSAAAMRAALRATAQQIFANGETRMNSSGMQTLVVQPGNSGGGLSAAVEMAQDMPLPATADATVLVVSPHGDGQYTTLAEAIAAVPAGGRIRIRPGTYHESLVLEKALELEGDGPRDDIIIIGEQAPVVQMQTEHATLRGLTLRSVAQADQPANHPTVHIPQGRLVIEDCDIVSETRLGVVIHGISANPVLWRCRIRGSAGIGVQIYGRGRGLLEECEIFDNVQAGVAIQHGASPTIRRCKVHTSGQDGIYVDRKGLGIIEDCDISHNVRAGIEIKRESSPLIRNCTVHHQTQGYGIFICENSTGTIETCTMSHNAYAGIGIVQGSNPLVRHCTITRERRGIFAGDGALGVIEHCTIRENGRVGVEIGKNSTPTLRYCTITNHRAVAIWVHDGGGGRVEHCDLRGNDRGAWHVEPGCRVVRSENKE